MSPCVEGAPEHITGKFQVLQLPGASTASGCMTVLSLQNTMTAKERDMGTRAYAVYMQFLWTAEGAGMNRGY